jgi:hypothetical protein
MIENLQGVNIFKAQLYAIIGSIVFFIFIMAQIRSKRLKEEYSLLWLLFSIIFLVLSVWRDGLQYLSIFIGIAYPPAALFLLLIMTELVILIQFSFLISRLSDRNKTLVQEVSLLKLEIEKMKKDLEDLKK